MRFMNKTGLSRMLALVLILSLSLSFLGAAAPPEKTENNPSQAQSGQENQTPGASGTQAGAAGGEEPLKDPKQGGDLQQPGSQNGKDPDQPGSQNGKDPDQPGSQDGKDLQQPGSQNGKDPDQPGSQDGKDPKQPGPQDGKDPKQPGPQDGKDPKQPGSQNGKDPDQPGPQNGQDPDQPGPQNGKDPDQPGSQNEGEPEQQDPPEGNDPDQPEPLPDGDSSGDPEGEPPVALSWTWVWEDPSLSDVLGKEADTGLYILDILQGEMPLEAVTSVLPQAVRFAMSDETTRELTVSSWTSEYPEAGIPTPEETRDYPFTPVFSEEMPPLAEGVPAPGLVARVAGEGGPEVLPAQTGTQTVNFYVILDNERVHLGTHQVTSYQFGESRRYLDADTLAGVYSPYGFRKEYLQVGTRYFPHAAAGEANIWTAPCHEDQGRVYSPILTNDGAADVYYMPGQKIPNRTSRGYPYVNYTRAGSDYDGFYSVRVQDPYGYAYGSEAGLPELFLRPGSSRDITLEPEQPVTWTVSGNAQARITENTVSLEQINGPVVIRPELPPLKEGEKRILYDTNVEKKPVNEEFEHPLINGRKSYAAVFTDTHTVLPALPSYYFSYTVKGQKWLARISFVEWVGDDGHTYAPGAVIRSEDLAGRELVLKARWKEERASQDNWESDMVNFYVSLTPVQEGDQTWTATGEDAGYTDSVYTTSCGVTARYFADSMQTTANQTLRGANSNQTEKTLDQCYQEVMQLQSGWDYETTRGETLHFQVDFPTDEEVLAHIRALPDGTLRQIRIGQRSLPREAFNTDNFTIKWSKFSSSTSGGPDGWHIDGVLTVKRSKLIVKKSFSGDGTAVEAVKNGDFRIVVEAVDPQHTTYDSAVLTLRETPGTLGPTKYDGDADEYIWVVPVDPLRDYTVREENAQAVGCQFYSWYNLRNSYESAHNTPGGWVQLPQAGRISLTARGGSDQENNYTTVAFKNTYTKPDSLTLTKLDGFSKNPMPGISFTLSYRKAPEAPEESLGTRVTDSRGIISLENARPGIYTFLETVPRGYADPGRIQVEVRETEPGMPLVIGSCSAEKTHPLNPALPHTDFSPGSMEFTVFNYSRAFVPVTAHKTWGKNTPQQDITLQLMLNGSSMGEAFQARLPAGTPGSSYVWDNLPLFIRLPVTVDQEPARYTVRELAIGNMSYSPDYDSGYRYYNVELGPMTYVMQDGSTATVMPENDEQITGVTLEITNTKRTGSPSIRKTDTSGFPLAGAEFTLYDMPQGDSIPAVNTGPQGNTLDRREVAKARSDQNGFVNFGTDLPVGEYYLIESQVPEGYRNNTSLYLLEFDSVSVHLKKWLGGSWQNMGKNTVTNTPIYVNLIVTNRTEGNMADTQLPFEFYLGSTRPIQKAAAGSQQESKQHIFYLKNGESTETSFELRVQSGSQVTLSQSTGYEYSASYTVTRFDSGGQVISTSQGQGFTMLDEVIRGLPEGSTVRVDIVNTLDISPNTGVDLDGLPWWLLLAAAGLGLAVLLLSGRRRRDLME